MEDLLTPQICMDVDDTPLDVGKESSDDETQSEHSQPDDDDKVKKLLEYEFKDPAQVPDELTDFEKEAKKNVFSPGELAVQFHKLHCTSCNLHLGSAPISFFNRYIHPILKVLICKKCYEFYCSGDFDKDEDGSEMYCRWCGQGGKVMCCAQCAYVFCQKCVRQNLGKKTLEIIKDSDDWLCFGCNAAQLINLKIICVTLYDFMQEEIRLAKALVNVERLKIDHSMCCTKVRPSAKRKREEDDAYSPYVDDMKVTKKGKTLAKSKLVEALKGKHWSAKKDDGEEVVCAPDVLSLMDEDNSDNIKNPPTAAEKEFKANTPCQVTPRKALFTAGPPRPLFICSSGNAPKLGNNIANVVRIQTPAIKLVSPTNPTSTTVPLLTSIPVQLVPGLKHEWFERAATVVSTITGNLAFTLDTLTNELKGSKTVENLATVHNKLQELLSTSINSLIQVRKSLRNQFLTDLNNLKFTAEKNAMANKMVPILPHPSADDDDVIIVKSDLVPKKEPVRSNGRPYLKVRTVSQLLSVPAECITIPDDPPEDPLQQDGLKIINDAFDETKKDDPLKCNNKENEFKDEKSEIVTVEITSPEKPNEDGLEISESTDKNDKTLEKDSKEPVDKSNESENNTGSLDDNSAAKTVSAENDDTTNKSGGSTSKEKEEDQPHDLSEYDTETSILIKNALRESKLDQIIDENLKCNTDYSDEELRKMLSVRVMVAPGLNPPAPTKPVEDDVWFTDDIENQLSYSIVSNCLKNKSSEGETVTPADNPPIVSPIESGAEEVFCDDEKIVDDENVSGIEKMDDIEKENDLEPINNSKKVDDIEEMDDLENIDNNEKIANQENMDTATEENCDNSNGNTEKTVDPHQEVTNGGIFEEAPESSGANKNDLSDKDTDREKTVEDDKSEAKEENSENAVSDLEDNTQINDDSRTELSNELITDSGVEADSKWVCPISKKQL